MVYSSAQKRYLQFCESYNLAAIPAVERVLLMYVTYLHDQKLKYSTIKTYLSALRSMHVLQGFPNPLENCHRLQMALRSIQQASDAPIQKLPITVQLLCNIRDVMGIHYNDKLMWAAMTLGLFGLLRAAEFTVTSSSGFNSQIHMTLSDIKLELSSQCKYMIVHIKRSKTCKHSSGVNVKIGCTETKVCALCAMVDFLACRTLFDSNPHEPLFLYKNGISLSREILVFNTRLYISMIGINPDRFTGHSFRVGGATSMAASGFTEWEIMMLGRWSSDAYLRYIKAPVELQASFAKRMASPQSKTLFSHLLPYKFK
jgi:hypothetical protein